MINWIIKSFSELTIEELYAIMEARVKVFVVEQNCPYQELDGEKDRISEHIFCYQEDSTIGAYARIVPPKKSFHEVSIGRILTSNESRGSGLGFTLMNESIAFIEKKYGHCPIRIGAQVYAIPFYEKIGFKSVEGKEYLEDNIPHVEMLRS